MSERGEKQKEKTKLRQRVRSRVCVCGHKAYDHWHGRDEDEASYDECARCRTCRRFTEAKP